MSLFADTYRGFVDCTRTVFRNEGIAGFFKGMHSFALFPLLTAVCAGISPALLRAFPHHAAVFLGYELTLRRLTQPRAAPEQLELAENYS